MFQPFLRFWRPLSDFESYIENIEFQPFLRFWGLCGWLWWVFKFFFGFLWARRSAWTNALHSFHSALGRSEAPFFGASRKRRREKGGKVRHSSQCRAPGLGGVCGVYQQACPVDGLRLAWASPLSRSVYRLFAATSLCLAPLTTSSAPILASLRQA